MDINIKVNKATRDAIPDKNKIGVEGENLQEKLVFYFEDEFVDGVARLEYEQDGVENYIPLEKIDETYVVPVKSIITKAWKLNLQLVITENEQSEGIPLFKSDIFEVYITNSINAVDEAPDGYDLWIDIANAKLLVMDEKIDEANDAIENISTAIQEVENLDIDVEETSTGSTIEITKKDGTKKDVIVPKSGQYDDTELRQLIAQKQNALISGINIKTINNETILGQGNIDLSNYKLYSNDDITLWYSYTGVKNIENINAEIEGESHNILEILPMFLTSPISEMQYIIGEMAVFLKMFKVPSTSYIDPTTSQYLFVDMPFLGELALTIIESNGEYTFSFIHAHSVYENTYYYTVDISNETPVLEIVYALSDKQNRLVSGENIKTINNQNILGSGNIEVSVKDDLFKSTSEGFEYYYAGIKSLEGVEIIFDGQKIPLIDVLEAIAIRPYSGDENVTVVNQALEYIIKYGTIPVSVKENKMFTIEIPGVLSAIFQLDTEDNTKIDRVWIVNHGWDFEPYTLEASGTGDSFEIEVMYRGQNLLVSGENIKTINGNSLLGSGNIDIQGGGSEEDISINWGDIEGTLSNQTDLSNTLNSKVDTSKIKNANSTAAGDVYDVRYINTMIGDIESLLSEV